MHLAGDVEAEFAEPLRDRFRSRRVGAAEAPVLGDD
jgi:hypothetical protein